MTTKMTEENFAKVPLRECACGCGQLIKSKNRYYWPKKYAEGHYHRKYSDRNEYQRVYRRKNHDKYMGYKKLRGRRIKRELVIRLGGKCAKCGIELNENNECIFQFDHRDQSKKLLGLSQSFLIRRSLAVINEELKKCDLLCANCHTLKHYLGKYK